jgi:hypothetical protein
MKKIKIKLGTKTDNHLKFITFDYLCGCANCDCNVFCMSALHLGNVVAVAKL